MHCATPSVPASRSGLIRGPNESKRYWPLTPPYVPIVGVVQGHADARATGSRIPVRFRSERPGSG